MSGFDINQLTISGNLTTDPELRHLASGTALCKIRIAHNERRKLQSGDWVDQPQFFDVTIWAGIGEWTAANLAKGDKRQAIDISADSGVPVPRSTSPTVAGDDDIPF